MFSDRLIGEESLRQDLESLSVSKRLVWSVSQKLRKKNHKSGVEEVDAANGVSMRCLTLYSGAGGCRVGADTSDEFGDTRSRRRSSTSDERKGYKPICGTEEAALDCFSYAVRERWRHLTTTPRFHQLRREGLYQNPWLFLFGAVKDGFCSGEILAFDVSLDQWHRINAKILQGSFMFYVRSIQDEIFVVGGCSSFTNFGKVDRSSFKTHKGVVLFSLLTKSWRKISSMRHARSIPILGVSEYRTASDENEASLLPNRKSYRFSTRMKSDQSSSKSFERFVLIAVGGLGCWDEPLDSGEIYDSLSNKWTEIQRLPIDFGVTCSGVACN
ncbi:F-box/kelch-repeat protein [Quillaja saponaria]|uniref:F-box/kelch-repeat protein n=1 Tax=Quillaja saponaria TaxID=32244 RepID=A0AAD7LZ80_QUISA|nr:F-box/kelch-repeat protein [Quillaja saponaria]